MKISARTILSVFLSMAVFFMAPAHALAVLADNLDGVILYPNPFQPHKGHTNMVFDHLTDSSRVRIYKVTGDLVYDKTASTPNGIYVWDVVNDHGNALSSGLYIYLITNGLGHEAKGKLLILK